MGFNEARRLAFSQWVGTRANQLSRPFNQWWAPLAPSVPATRDGIRRDGKFNLRLTRSGDLYLAGRQVQTGGIPGLESLKLPYVLHDPFMPLGLLATARHVSYSASNMCNTSVLPPFRVRRIGDCVVRPRSIAWGAYSP